MVEIVSYQVWKQYYLDKIYSQGVGRILQLYLDHCVPVYLRIGGTWVQGLLMHLLAFQNE